MSKHTPNMCVGKVISLIDNKLVVGREAGKERSHILTKDATITCDGIVGKPDDIRSGRMVRVTTKASDRNLAIAVEILDKNVEFVKLAEGPL